MAEIDENEMLKRTYVTISDVLHLNPGLYSVLNQEKTVTKDSRPRSSLERDMEAYAADIGEEQAGENLQNFIKSNPNSLDLNPEAANVFQELGEATGDYIRALGITGDSVSKERKEELRKAMEIANIKLYVNRDLRNQSLGRASEARWINGCLWCEKSLDDWQWLEPGRTYFKPIEVEKVLSLLKSAYWGHIAIGKELRCKGEDGIWKLK
jgi:hypothetical protein